MLPSWPCCFLSTVFLYSSSSFSVRLPNGLGGRERVYSSSSVMKAWLEGEHRSDVLPQPQRIMTATSESDDCFCMKSKLWLRWNIPTVNNSKRNRYKSQNILILAQEWCPQLCLPITEIWVLESCDLLCAALLSEEKQINVLHHIKAGQCIIWYF